MRKLKLEGLADLFETFFSNSTKCIKAGELHCVSLSVAQIYASSAWHYGFTVSEGLAIPQMFLF